MRYFVGRDRDNHVPTGNGQLLATFQQYGENQVPSDRISQLYFPTFDLTDSLLGTWGSSVLVRDPEEKVWYDPYDLIRSRPGLYGEFVTIDKTRFVKGTGIYQVLSHKGVNLVQTTTWIPRQINAVVRRIQVGSLKRQPVDVDVFPVVHIKNAYRSDGNRIFCLVHGVYLAVECPGAEAWHMGDLASGLLDGFNNRIPALWLTDQRWKNKDLTLSYRVTRRVPTQPAGTLPVEDGWADPVYLLMGVGQSEEEAIEQLERVLASPDRLYRHTLEEGRAWLEQGALLAGPDPEWNDLWRTSLSLLRTAIQTDGSPIMVGFREYQGRVWLRDSIWIAVTLARTGHLPEAVKVLRRLAILLRTRQDGNFCFAYEAKTGEPAEHTYENDSTGLLLFGFEQVWRASGDQSLLRESQGLLRYCADWIVANVDPVHGMVKACAGIWETFGPHLEREHEHMAWTSGVSAYGLRAFVAMMEALEEPIGPVYGETAAALIDRLVALAGEGPLPRSVETQNLDASVLTFFSWMPLFDPKGELATKTLAAIEQRLVDPCMGGVWRHEDLTTEWGDMRPWIGPTLWLSEAFLRRGQVAEAWKYVDWVNHHRTFCGLVPELMFAHDIPRGIAMPSYSQSGIPIALLRHFDESTGAGCLPPGWDWMRITNVPDGHGGRHDLQAGKMPAGVS